jgi:uncharacterized protein (TIGR00251 family)
MSAAWQRYDAAAHRLTLSLHVQPGAKKSGIAGLHGDALKVKIAAPATDNQANAALVEFLSALLDVPKSSISIRRGATSRRKIVEISGGEEMANRVAALAAS